MPSACLILSIRTPSLPPSHAKSFCYNPPGASATRCIPAPPQLPAAICPDRDWNYKKVRAAGLACCITHSVISAVQKAAHAVYTPCAHSEFIVHYPFGPIRDVCWDELFHSNRCLTCTTPTPPCACLQCCPDATRNTYVPASP